MDLVLISRSLISINWETSIELKKIATISEDPKTTESVIGKQIINSPISPGQAPSGTKAAIVVAVDTTQGTDSNRVKIYANGVLQGLSTTTYPSQNEDLNFNNTVEHQLMHNFDGYLSEMHFVDGTALTPASFG